MIETNNCKMFCKGRLGMVVGDVVDRGKLKRVRNVTVVESDREMERIISHYTCCLVEREEG